MDLGDFRERLASSRLEPRTLGVCLALTDVLTDVRPGDGQHLGLAFFRERLDGNPPYDEILPALSILCSFEGAILEMHGYLDDVDEGQLHLQDDDFSELLVSGRLAHPVSGELVQNPMAEVKIFYSLRGES